MFVSEITSNLKQVVYILLLLLAVYSSIHKEKHQIILQTFCGHAYDAYDQPSIIWYVS